MTKILIIDDTRDLVWYMTKALEVLPDVTISACTESKGDPTKRHVVPKMPPKEEVLAAIREADIILLDGEICAEYGGFDLLPFCEGKKVLGISSQYKIGQVVWTGKEKFFIPSRTNDFFPDSGPDESLRNAVIKLIGIQNRA